MEFALVVVCIISLVTIVFLAILLRDAMIKDNEINKRLILMIAESHNNEIKSYQDILTSLQEMELQINARETSPVHAEVPEQFETSEPFDPFSVMPKDIENL